MSGVRAVGGAGSSLKLQYDLLRCESWVSPLIPLRCESWVSPLNEGAEKKAQLALAVSYIFFRRH